MKLAIVGTGIVHPAGKSAKEILEQESPHLTGHRVEQISLKAVDSSTARRTTQYAKILIKSAELAIEESGIDMDSVNKERFGTIMNTVYGPLETSLKFATSVLKGDPDLVSPLVFANTVTNASLGHLCITYGLKGDSTCLMGSNPLKYADYLFQKRTIDTMLVAGTEEYSEGLAMEYEKFYSDQVRFLPKECGAVLMLQSEHEQALGYIYKSFGMSVTSNPYFEQADVLDFQERLQAIYSEITSQYDDIDLIIQGASGTPFEEAEIDVFRKHDLSSFINYKPLLGEVFGASLVAYTILALQALEADPEVRKVAVNYLDVSMNYFTVIVGRN